MEVLAEEPGEDRLTQRTLPTLTRVTVLKSVEAQNTLNLSAVAGVAVKGLIIQVEDTQGDVDEAGKSFNVR